MLKQRIITAVILASVALWALFGWSPLFYGMFLLLATFACAWEWSVLGNIESKTLRYAFSISVTGLAALLMWSGNLPVLKVLVLLSVLSWLAMALDLMVRPVIPAAQGSKWGLLLLASLVLVTSVVSLYWLRSELSATAIVFIIALVAAADIGAYFSGRRFGKRKLASQISAGKTIEGAIGGMLLALFVALIAVVSIDFGDHATLIILLFAVIAAVFSIAGDLFISRAKRTRGVKDSGSVLPGHGGVLDRFDGLLAAVPWMTFAVLWT